MKSTMLLATIALAFIFAVFATTAVAAPLPAGTKLLIEPGVGSEPNTPCSTGSCFGMLTAPGLVIWIDFGPGTDGGFVVGKAQMSGGQELGPSPDNTTPGELSAAWSLFGNYGTFFTSPGGDTENIFDDASCAGADCIGKTELRVFYIAWNGESIPMGSAAGCTLPSCTPDQAAGIFVADWQIDLANGTWSMVYNQVVPEGNYAGLTF